LHRDRVPVRPHHQQVRVAHVPGEEEQQQQRRRVGRVQIVQDQQQRLDR
jgi:hypothetical protein